jgi:CheY-like chemotaxis protein
VTDSESITRYAPVRTEAVQKNWNARKRSSIKFTELACRRRQTNPFCHSSDLLVCCHQLAQVTANHSSTDAIYQKGAQRAHGGTLTDRSEDDYAAQFATWKVKRLPTSYASRRVLIGHQDKAVADSLALSLRLNGSQVMHAQSLQSLRPVVVAWRPHALLLDTRLDVSSGFAFLRSLQSTDGENMLLVAMSNNRPFDAIDTLKAAGFDAHCRRPCATWRIAGLLDDYFAETRLHERALRQA